MLRLLGVVSFGFSFWFAWCCPVAAVACESWGWCAVASAVVALGVCWSGVGWVVGEFWVGADWFDVVELEVHWVGSGQVWVDWVAAEPAA